MKIVLNKCYGRFRLSHEAKMEIYKKRGMEVFPYIFSWEADKIFYEIVSTGKLDDSLEMSVAYFQINPKKDNFTEDVFSDSEYHPIQLDFHYEDRGNEDLVEVVEKLGKLASGSFSDLRVVEIPDGASYEISDYDGVEIAHYGFQLGLV